MAKVREQSDGLSGDQTNRKSNGLTGTSRTVDDGLSTPASGGWRSRIGSFFAPPPRTTATLAQRDAKTAQPRSSWGRLLFGFMVYLLGSFILQPLILLIFGWLHINPAARQPFFPANTWVIGTANVYTLVYFVFLAVFIWALFRFNIIPRDPFGARAAAQRRSGGTSATGASGASGSANSGASVLPPAASARRHAGRRRLPMTDGTSTPKPVRSFGSFLSSLRPRGAAASSATPATKTTAKTPAKPALKTTSVTTTKAAAGSGAKATTNGSGPKTATKVAASTATRAPSANASNASANNGHVAASTHDSHYDRVKAQQRSRRRKR